MYPSNFDPAAPVGESRLGSAALALLLLPCVFITGAVLVAGVFFLLRASDIGAREILTLLLGAAFFPVLARALVIMVARIFGKRLEPLVPWWLSIPIAVFFAVGTVAATIHGSIAGFHGQYRLWGSLVPLLLAPFLLHRQQRRRNAQLSLNASPAVVQADRPPR